MNLRYPSIDELAKIVQEKGRGCKIFRRDMKKCYRQFFMDPAAIHLLGYIVDKKLYFDVSLSMGSKSSTFCCQKTTSAIMHIFRKHNFQGLNYLDDLGSAEVKELAEKAFETLGQILREIGIIEVEDKAIKPAVVAVFLGVLFNTEEMTMTIPPDRIKELRLLLEGWRTRTTASLRELQQLLGKLNFVCNTVRAGRIFVSRLINMVKETPARGRRRLNGKFKKDVEWWYKYMSRFDGISMIPDVRWQAPDVVLSTDSCLTGGGGWSSGEFFHVKYPKWLTDKENVFINELETMALIVGLKIWRERIRNCNILAYCDNQVTTEIVNSGRAKNKFAQACLREVCWITAQVNAWVKVVFTPGISNRISDSLSRWHLGEQFREQFKKDTKNWEVKECEVVEGMLQFEHIW